MVNHDKQEQVFKNEQINWERSHDFGSHLLVLHEGRSKLLEFRKQTKTSFVMYVFGLFGDIFLTNLLPVVMSCYQEFNVFEEVIQTNDNFQVVCRKPISNKIIKILEGEVS